MTCVRAPNGCRVGRLADAAFTDAALRRAWTDVRDNASEDGEPSARVKAFDERIDEEVGRLVADLAWGAYEPRDLTEVIIDESDKRRALHIPTLRDRIVERAILEVITPYVDPLLGCASYAYRPGLGVVDAVQAVAALRDEGLRWVVRTDVDDCFPTIPVTLARRMLGSVVDDPEVLRVVDLLLARGYTSRRRGRRVMRGLAQGCALSPLLANLVLAGVDERVLDAGFALVRYADDMVIAAGSRDEAWEAVRVVSDAVEQVGMSLGAEDTQVMSFDEGFTFLGEDFGPRYPPVLTGARVEEPDRRVVYVATQGGRVRTAAGRLIVETSDDAEVLDVPTGQVSRIVAFGSVGVSAGVRSWALSNGVDVVFASRRGSYLGSYVGADQRQRADRVRAQVAITDTAEALAISRAIVEAKIAKQLVVLRRFGRREHAETVSAAIESIQGCLRLLPDCSTTAEVMGMEGAAAAAYFPAYGALLPDGLSFTLRSRQPPMDVANSALGYLYTVLLGECETALYAAGLDPMFGVLHTDHEDRPSLALDLMEEFRPLVVDQVVISCARLGSLQATHGRSDDGRAGVMLTKAGRLALLDAYERRMLTRTRGALPDFGGTLRRHLYRQAQRLRASIMSDDQPWTGLSWR